MDRSRNDYVRWAGRNNEGCSQVTRFSDLKGRVGSRCIQNLADRVRSELKV